MRFLLSAVTDVLHYCCIYQLCGWQPQLPVSLVRHALSGCGIACQALKLLLQGQKPDTQATHGFIVAQHHNDCKPSKPQEQRR